MTARRVLAGATPARLFLAALVLVALATCPAAAAPFAYVPSSAGTVVVIDTATNTNAGTVRVGANPIGVAVHPLATFVYVTNASDGTLSVISTANNAVVATIPVGSGPLGVAVDPAGTRVYVANAFSGTLSVISTASNTVVATIPVGSSPFGVAVHPSGNRVYVTNNSFTGTVAVVDTSLDTVTTTISVGSGAAGIALHPAGTLAYVANSGSSTVSIVNTSTNTVTLTVPAGISPTAVAVNPAGTRVYVTNTGSNAVSILDATTGAAVTTIPLGGTPQGLALTTGGTRLYVTQATGPQTGAVAVIDVATNSIVTSLLFLSGIPSGLGPFVAVPARSVRLALSGTQFRAGQTVTLGLEAQNTSTQSLDLFLGVVFPDQQTVVFLSTTGTVAGVGRSDRPTTFVAAQTLRVPFGVSAPSLFRFTFPATGLPSGTFEIIAALVRDGALDDGRVDPGDTVAVDAKSLTFSP